MDQYTRNSVENQRIDLAREADFPIGGLVVRPYNLTISGSGVSHVLQPRIMQVLVALARSRSNVVSHDELIRRCWSGLSVSDDAVGRCISQLRKLAEKWPEPPFSIVTITGVGYRLEVTTHNSQDKAPETPDFKRSPAADKRRAPWISIAGVIAVLTVGSLGWTFLHSSTPLPATRVAVLPLEVLGSQSGLHALAGGIADEIDHALSDGQVEVLPRTDAGALGAAKDANSAAKAGVGLLVNGSISEAPGGALVNLRLENAGTHVTLWSGDFRCADTDCGALREQVAVKIADMITIAEFARQTPGMRSDDVAMSALLQVQQLLRSNRSGSWGQLVAMAQRIVAREPEFAFGHSTAATAYAYAIGWGAPLEQRAALVASARREAAQALALDPHDAAAYFALNVLEPDYEHKETLLQRGLAVATHPIAPLAALYNAQGHILLSTGRPIAALPYLQRSVGLDPLSPVKAVSLIEGYELAGDTGAALETISQALVRWPDHLGLRATRLHLLTFYGSRKAALALLSAPSELPPDLAPQAVAAWSRYLNASDSRPETAQAVAKAASGGALDLKTAVLMLAELGDRNAAFVFANRLAEKPAADPAFLFEPVAAPLRKDPRFRSLADRFALIAYWRKTGYWPDFCSGPHEKQDCLVASASARSRNQ